MRLAIVDDEILIRQGLEILLQQYEDVDVVATCENGLEICKLAESQTIDVVLMDIRMPKMNGVEATRYLKENFPGIKILILTTFSDDEYIHEALSLGAFGYLLKDAKPQQIYQALKSANDGHVVIEPSLLSQVVSRPRVSTKADDVVKQHKLSEKELTIIRHIADGLTNSEIASAMFLAEGTVKNNVSQILSKLTLRDRTQLVIFAFRNQLIIE